MDKMIDTTSIGEDQHTYTLLYLVITKCLHLNVTIRYMVCLLHIVETVKCLHLTINRKGKENKNKINLLGFYSSNTCNLRILTMQCQFLLML